MVTNISINERTLYDLVKGKTLKIPDYQREYSWNATNWEEFIYSIIGFIENYKEKGKWYLKNKYFAGDIIFERKTETHHGKSETYFNIIDGQQRLITIFLILTFAYKKIGKDSAEEDIKDILFLDDSQKAKIVLTDERNREELKQIFSFSSTGKLINPPPKKERSNVFQAYEWFSRFLTGEAKDYFLDICNVLTKSLCFASLEIGEEESVWELFAALNTTGLNLSAVDLIKGLIIENCIDRSKEETRIKWKKEVVEIVCFSSSQIKRDQQKINREVENFLEDFWIAKFGEEGEIRPNKKISLKSIRNNIYELFKYKVKTVDKKSDTLLDLLVKYAKVYGNIKEPDYTDWKEKETGWPVQFFYTIKYISLLEFNRLFPVILKAHFWLKEEELKEGNKKENRKIMTEELEILFLYMFRTITIKDKSYDEIRKHILSILSEISRGRLLNEDLSKTLSEEFKEKETNDFYAELKKYRQKKSSVWKFILESYYTEVFHKNQKIRSCFDIKKAIMESEELTVEHLIPRKLPSEIPDEQAESLEKDQTQYSLGNITLLKQKLNSRISNWIWKRKREELRKKSQDCMLAWENHSPNFFNLEELTAEKVGNRTDNLIVDFKEMDLFVPKSLRKEPVAGN